MMSKLKKIIILIIIDGDLKKEGNAIILEKEMTYVFEIKKRVEDFFK